MKTSRSALGLLFVFALTGFMGLTLGPIDSHYATALPNGSQVVMIALGITGVTFVGPSAYAVKSGRDFSFMGGFLTVGILGAFLFGLVAYFFQMPTLALAVSGMFVLAMGGSSCGRPAPPSRAARRTTSWPPSRCTCRSTTCSRALLHLLGVMSDD